MLYRFGWLLCQIPFRLFYRIKVIGRKNFIKKGKCVGVCNHYNLADVPNLAVRFCRNIRFVAKKELYKTKLSAWLFRGLRAVPVDRNGTDISAVKLALKYLKEDRMLMLFPEGTRNKDGDGVKQIRAGAAVFAIKAKAPIVPFAYYKPPKMFRKNYLMVGEPFELAEFYGKRLTAEETEAAGEAVYQKMTALKAELDEYVDSRKKKKKKAEKIVK